jgi:hypothetical protein
MHASAKLALTAALLCAACSSRQARYDRREGRQQLSANSSSHMTRAFDIAAPAAARSTGSFVATAPTAVPALAEFSGITNSDEAALALPDARAMAAPDSAHPARMLVVSARATLDVDSVAPVALRLRTLTVRLGGFVASSSAETGSDRVHAAEVEVRVPKARFDQLLDGIRHLGRLAALDASSEDVGEEYVDVDARLRNAHRLEDRLLALVSERTGRLRDVMEIERALASVREDIERLEGRVRYLRHNVALSTLRVTLREPQAAVAGAPGSVALSGAFRQAWDNFLWLATLAIQSLGVIVPLAVVAVAGWMALRRLQGRREAPVSIRAPAQGD